MFNLVRLQDEADLVLAASRSGKLKELSPRDIEILEMRYISPFVTQKWYTLRDIGEQFNLSAERINQIIKRSIRKLQND